MAFYQQEPLKPDSALADLTAIVLVNLGTPDEPTPAAIKRYLAEFLSDPRIIEAPKWYWYPILYGIILNTRPRKVAKAYAEVWTENGSPLLDYSLKLASKLDKKYPNQITVTTAMRYGNPSMESVLNQLKKKNLKKLLVIPLFPQYSASTTASVIDKLSAIFGQWRVIPDFRVVTDYHANPYYTDAIASQLSEHWSTAGKPDKLMFSFHGLPQQYIDAGDVYQQQCLRTAEKIVEKFDLDENEWITCFQSRFGPKQWIQPYTDITLQKLASQGTKSVDIICPGFAVDCLETIEEINMQNRELFLNAGGSRFNYIPALNDSDAHITLLQQLISENAADWLTETTD